MLSLTPQHTGRHQRACVSRTHQVAGAVPAGHDRRRWCRVRLGATCRALRGAHRPRLVLCQPVDLCDVISSNHLSDDLHVRSGWVAEGGLQQAHMHISNGVAEHKTSAHTHTSGGGLLAAPSSAGQFLNLCVRQPGARGPGALVSLLHVPRPTWCTLAVSSCRSFAAPSATCCSLLLRPPKLAGHAPQPLPLPPPLLLLLPGPPPPPALLLPARSSAAAAGAAGGSGPGTGAISGLALPAAVAAAALGAGFLAGGATAAFAAVAPPDGGAACAAADPGAALAGVLPGEDADAEAAAAGVTAVAPAVLAGAGFPCAGFPAPAAAAACRAGTAPAAGAGAGGRTRGGLGPAGLAGGAGAFGPTPGFGAAAAAVAAAEGVGLAEAEGAAGCGAAAVLLGGLGPLLAGPWKGMGPCLTAAVACAAAGCAAGAGGSSSAQAKSSMSVEEPVAPANSYSLSLLLDFWGGAMMLK